MRKAWSKWFWDWFDKLLMKLEKLLIKVLGLVMLSYFFFDSWKKYELANQSQGEIVKIKFQ